MPDKIQPGSPAPRRWELSLLNVGFCLLVVWIHIASRPISVLDRSSWQYGLLLVLQRLAFVSVPGFFFLSGVKLTLPQSRPRNWGRYWMGRVKKLLLPYVLAVTVYYLYFVQLGWFPFSPAALVRHLVQGDLSAQFYFLLALMQFIVLAPLFVWLTRRWSPVLLLPLALGITWMSLLFYNAVLHLVLPQVSLQNTSRFFTSYLVYYVAGCCAGASYGDFAQFLRNNRGLIAALFVFFTAADGYISLLHFSGRREAPYLEMVQTFYVFSAILFFLDLALHAPFLQPSPEGSVLRHTLFRVLARIDSASYLVYLYHCLTIQVVCQFAVKHGVTRTGAQLLLQLACTYPLTIGLSVLWQRLFRALPRPLLGRRPRPRRPL